MKKRMLLIPSLILALVIGLVMAQTYILHDWTLTITASTPDVRFIKWSDESLYNTIDLPYNIYADVWTQDANATHGIKNTSGSTDRTVYVYIDSINATTKIANVTVWVQDMTGSTTYATVTWQGGSLPTSEQSFNAVTSTSYVLKVWVKGASTIADVLVTLKMKVAE